MHGFVVYFDTFIIPDNLRRNSSGKIKKLRLYYMGKRFILLAGTPRFEWNLTFFWNLK